MAARSPKRTKMEPNESSSEEDEDIVITGVRIGSASGGLSDRALLKEQEQVLETIVKGNEAECERLQMKIARSTTLLEDEEKKMSENRKKLVRIRMSLKLAMASTTPGRAGTEVGKDESKREVFRTSVGQQPQEQQVVPKKKIFIPSFISKSSIPYSYGGSGVMLNPGVLSQENVHERVSSSFRSNDAILKPCSCSQLDRTEKVKQEQDHVVSTTENIGRSVGSANRKTVSKLEHKVGRDLIQNVCKMSSPKKIKFEPGSNTVANHRRRLRCLEFSPVNHHQFVTSALDGSLNLWQTEAKRATPVFVSSSPCLSPLGRWPEDLAWHPDGNSIFSVYAADGGDSQISVLNLSLDRKVRFLEEKPHHKGVINSISFMPWDDICFSTGGSDHAVILWEEIDDTWKVKPLHGNLHTAAVMGVAGLSHKKTVLSSGLDKRIVAFDLLEGRHNLKLQLEAKCMSVLPNPLDFNLIMVQTGEQKKQLRLYDIRLGQAAIHSFGWTHDSKQQSALIGQAWSPDGLYISSGSADPVIHIFDIRYNGQCPSQSLKAHQRRVFKAEWHKSLPLLVSISSDYFIGVHKMI